MASSREYPERPLVGVGGVLIEEGQVLLIRRGAEPLKGEWSIPGGTLELGESLAAGVEREMLEETGLQVRVGELIEFFDRVFYADGDSGGLSAVPNGNNTRPRYHYVIADYLCERMSGEARAGSDVTDVALVREEEIERYGLSEMATRIVRKAFALERGRGKRTS